MKKILLATGILILCGLAGACARIADPRPPVARIPAAVRDLGARQLADEIILTLSLPASNSDGSTPAAVEALEIFRVTEDLTADGAADIAAPAPLSEDEFKKRARHILSIPASRFPEYRHDNIFILRDQPPRPTPQPDATSLPVRRLRYAAMFVNRKNQAAGLGNQAVIQPLALPPAPDGLRATVTEKEIYLQWTAPATGAKTAPIAGYNVYRSPGPEITPAEAKPLNAAPLPVPEYRDRDFQLNQTRFYAVSVAAATTPAQPPAESALSAPLRVETRDVFAPAPPGDFTAVAESGKVTLFWTPSPSEDVAGYRLFRRADGRRERLGPEPVTGISYQDSGAAPNQKYVYEIQAVDQSGNASPIVEYAVQAAP